MHSSPTPPAVSSAWTVGDPAPHVSTILMHKGAALVLLTWSSLILVCIHGMAIHVQPAPAYGLEGAEMLPHLQRLAAWDALYRSHPSSGLEGSLAHAWSAVDGHYPPALHVVTATVQHTLGLGRSDLVLPLVLNLLALIGVVAVAYWQGTSAWPRSLPWRPDLLRLRLALGGVLVLTSPGLTFPVRRYYYDLPMTLTLVLLGCTVLCGRGLRSPLRALAGVMLTLLSLSVKWAAGLYLIPLWGAALALSLRGFRLTHWTVVASPLSAVLLLGLAGAMIWKSAPESLVFQLGLAAQNPGPSAVAFSMPGRLEFYLRALWSNTQGPWTSVLLLAGVLWSLREPHPWLRWSWALMPFGLVLAFLVLSGPTPDGRYIMPVLPWLLFAVSLLIPLRVPRITTGGIAALALLQVLWLDVSARAPLEPWQEWWWTTRTEDRPSRLSEIQPVVDAIAGHWPRASIRLESSPGASTWEHLLAYGLELRAPGCFVVEVHAQGYRPSIPSAGAAVRVRWGSLPGGSDETALDWQKVETDLGLCWVGAEKRAAPASLQGAQSSP